MYCKYCGRIIDDDSKYCVNCGNNMNNDNSIKEITKSLMTDTGEKWKDFSKRMIKGDFYEHLQAHFPFA